VSCVGITNSVLVTFLDIAYTYLLFIVFLVTDSVALFNILCNFAIRSQDRNVDRTTVNFVSRSKTKMRQRNRNTDFSISTKMGQFRIVSVDVRVNFTPKDVTNSSYHSANVRFSKIAKLLTTLMYCAICQMVATKVSFM